MGSCCSSTKIQPNKPSINKIPVESLLLSSNLNDNHQSDKMNHIVVENVNNGEQNKTSQANQVTFVNIGNKKTKYYNNYHKNINGQTIIKKPSEIDGEQVIFDSCSDSIFIFLDIVAQVTIEKCKNCSFYIGPCKSNVSLRNSSNINMISISQQLLCRNLENCQLSIFVMTLPTFEDCNNIKLGCYSFHNYIEFRGLFDSSEICLWENRWSEYSVFSMNSTINLYEGSILQEECFESILTKFNELNLNKFDYNYIPFTYGMSYDYINQPNILFFIDKNKITEEIYIFLSKENLDKQNCILIKTSILDKNEHVNLIDDLVSNLKNDSFENLIKVCFWLKTWNDRVDIVNFPKINKESHLVIYEISSKDLKPAIKKIFDSFNFKQK